MKRRVVLVTVILAVAAALALLEASMSRVKPITLEPGESSLNDILDQWHTGEKDAALNALRETGVERAFASSTYECLYLQERDMTWLRQFYHQDDIAEGIALSDKFVEIAREIRRRAGPDEDHPDVALIHEMAAELQKPTRLVLFQQVGSGLPLKRP